MAGGRKAPYTSYMWRRRLVLGGFLLGALLAACLLNCPAGHEGFFCRFATYAATPLLILLSPLVFLLSAAGLQPGHVAALAGSSVVTWTLAGAAAGLLAGPRRR